MKIAKPVRSLVEVKDAELISGEPRTDLGNLDGTRDNNGVTTRSVDYVFQITGKNPVATFTVQSEKGGTIKKEISLK
jgi:hypothetical protein